MPSQSQDGETVREMHQQFAVLQQRAASARSCGDMRAYGIDALNFLLRSLDDVTRMFLGEYEGLPRKFRDVGHALIQDLEKVLTEITKLVPDLRQGYIKGRMGAQLLKKAWSITQGDSVAELPEVSRLQLKSSVFFQKSFSAQMNGKVESVISTSMLLKDRIASHIQELQAYAETHKTKGTILSVSAWLLLGTAVTAAALVLGLGTLSGVMTVASKGGLLLHEAIAIGVLGVGATACAYSARSCFATAAAALELYSETKEMMQRRVGGIVEVLQELEAGMQSQKNLGRYVLSVLHYMGGEHENFKELNDPDFADVFRMKETGTTIDEYIRRMDGLVEKVDQLQTQAFRNMETLIPVGTRNPAVETLPRIFADIQTSANLRQVAAAKCQVVEDAISTTAPGTDSRSSGSSDVGSEWAVLRATTRSKCVRNLLIVSTGDSEFAVTADHPFTIRGPNGEFCETPAGDLQLLEVSNGHGFRPVRNIVQRREECSVVDVSFEGDERVLAWLPPAGRRRPASLDPGRAFVICGNPCPPSSCLESISIPCEMRVRNTFLEVVDPVQSLRRSRSMP